MAKQLSVDEIYAKVKQDYDIESLLKPYEQGGTESQPVIRSSGTVLDWLINKKKFPPDVAGAGLIAVLMECKAGKSFQGDGSYGSAGRAFVHAVAMKCDDFNKQKLRVEMFKTIAGAKLEVMDEVIFEKVRSQLPAPVRIIAPGSWRWLRNRRKAKASMNEPA